MSEYGVTDKGFVLKRMDTILEEVHADLTEGFGVDTRLLRPSFLDTLVTTFSGQIAELWETAQDNYYAKYPATANGVNLDNSVQYGGIRREGNKKTVYPLHCTGDDGTYVREEAIVATNTSPEIRLRSADEFLISRDTFNKVVIVIAAEQTNTIYSVTINGNQYSYKNADAGPAAILKGLKEAIKDTEYNVSADSEAGTLTIEDTVKSRSNSLVLTDNLTTSSVTVIANFQTEEYGKITLPYNIVTKMVNNITGFTAVTNLLEPTYGRTRETDIELRQSYIAKSALRAETMVDAIVAELLNNVANVETAIGYENVEDEVDERGLSPHSIEIIVEGGDDTEIAQTILRKKAGGIQTNGNHEVTVSGVYGDPIPIRFNRPEYLYTWLKVVLYGNSAMLPTNYKNLATLSLIEDGSSLVAGVSLLTDLFKGGIYAKVAGITKAVIYTAWSTDKSYIPNDSDYKLSNVLVTARQKVLVDENRINVSFGGSEV